MAFLQRRARPGRWPEVPGLHPQLVSVPQSPGGGPRGARAPLGREGTAAAHPASSQPAQPLPEPESGRARPLPAGGGRRREPAGRAVGTVGCACSFSSATTPGACACVCVGSGSAVLWQRPPENPAPTRLFACLLAGSLHLQDPHLRPISISSRVGLAWWEWVCVSAWWSGQPQVGELGYRVGWGARRVCGWRREAWGGDCWVWPGQDQGPHVGYAGPLPAAGPPSLGRPDLCGWAPMHLSSWLTGGSMGVRGAWSRRTW